MHHPTAYQGCVNLFTILQKYPTLIPSIFPENVGTLLKGFNILYGTTVVKNNKYTSSGQALYVQQGHRHMAAAKLIRIFRGSCKQGMKQGVDSERAEWAQGKKRVHP